MDFRDAVYLFKHDIHRPSTKLLKELKAHFEQNYSEYDESKSNRQIALTIKILDLMIEHRDFT